MSGTTTEGGAEENKDKTEGPAEGEEAPDPTPGTSNGTETPGQTPEGTDPPAADGDGERQHAPGCTLPADHEGDCQTEQAPQPAACTKTEGCTLTEGHDGDCVLAETPAPCDRTEGCTLEVGHEGECVVEEQPEFYAVQAGETVNVDGNYGHPIRGDDLVISGCADGCDGHTIIGSTSRNRIVVSDGTHTLRFESVSIDLSTDVTPYTSPIIVEGGANVTMEMVGDNIFDGSTSWPGILVRDGAKLNIIGSGNIDATASVGGAGISVEGGATLTLANDGEIRAVAAGEKPGIDVQAGTTLNIAGTGTLIANGSGELAGIMVSENSTLTVDGSKVITANGSGAGAGIGVSPDATMEVKSTYIGTITAQGGGGSPGTGAAGIGGHYGANSNFGDIFIHGGTVIAQGSGGGAGIGGGYETGSGTVTGNVTITGGTVKAHGGRTLAGVSTGAGIGAGENADYNGTITISGGIVYADGGDEDAAAIGGGGRGFGGTANGTFQTGDNGNAVIIAPRGIGDTSGVAEWSGFFIGYNFDENAAVYDEQSNTVIFNTPATVDGNRSTAQVFGIPAIDFNIEVANGGSLTVIAENMGGASQMGIPRGELVIPDGYKLTNNGELVVNGLLRLEDGILGNTDGDGTLTVNELDYNAIVQVRMDDAIHVIVEARNNLTYTGKEQTPPVRVEADTLWGYDLPLVESVDYTQSYQNNVDAGSAQVVVTPIEDVTSSLFGDAKEENFTIYPAQLEHQMPSSWTVAQGEAELIKRLPATANITADGFTQAELSQLLKNEKLTWSLSDGSDVQNDSLANARPGDDITLHWVYTQDNTNFTTKLEGDMKIIISAVPVYNGRITDTDADEPINSQTGIEKTYGENPLNLKISLHDRETDDEKNIQSQVTWAVQGADGIVKITPSGNHDENAKVEITGVGTVYITATVAQYDAGTPDESYAQVSSSFRLTVKPKPVQVDTSKTEVADRAYNGSANVDVKAELVNETTVIIKDDVVKLVAAGVMNDANAGPNKPVNITYSLDGDDAGKYVLTPTSDTATVTIERADWGENSGFKITGNEVTLKVQNYHARQYSERVDRFKLVVTDQNGQQITSGNPNKFTLDLSKVVIYDDRYFTNKPATQPGEQQDITLSSFDSQLNISVNRVETTEEKTVAKITILAESKNFTNIPLILNVESTNSDMFAIDAKTENAGGSITPSGTDYVPKGESSTYTITADPGYVIDEVRVDGAAQADAVGETSYTYDFTNVSSGHLIVARFRVDDTKPTPDPDPGHGGGSGGDDADYADIRVTKVDEDGDTISRTASFIVYKKSGGEILYKTVSGRWTEDRDEAWTYYTRDGKFTVYDLKPGTYYIEEIKAPDGYQRSDEDLKVEVDYRDVSVEFENLESSVPDSKPNPDTGR